MSTSNTSGIHHAHHFKNLEHQHDTGKLGVWFFLATEILMFGGLIVGYIIMNGQYEEMFGAGASTLDWKLGALNTVILLISSYTMAVAVNAAQTNQNDKCFKFCWITVLCGVGFMVVKAFEYTGKLSHGMAPGRFFDIAAVMEYKPAIAETMKAFVGTTEAGMTTVDMGMYYAFYFCMTGLHASHVLIGMGLIAWVAMRAKRGDFNSEHYTAVEGVGLFWHLVDLIWIYLFPLLYLVG